MARKSKGNVKHVKVEGEMTDADWAKVKAMLAQPLPDADESVDSPDFQAHEFWSTVNDLPLPDETAAAGPMVGVACPNGHLGCWDRECWTKEDE
jgi:hypothetical protein